MKPTTASPAAAAELRAQAEAAFQAKAATSPTLTPEGAQIILHELQIHQIELEMQNEELRRAQAELEVSRASYFDLYNLAPNGYCTLSAKGLIQKANLTLATMLGVPRAVLVNQPIFRFVLKEDADRLYVLLLELIKAGPPRTTELRMLRPDHDPLWVHVASTTTLDDNGAPVIHFALSDIAELKLAVEALRIQAEQLAKSNEALKSRTVELQNNNRAQEDWHRMTVGRELRMTELKREINALNKRLGEAPAYPTLVPGFGEEISKPSPESPRAPG